MENPILKAISIIAIVLSITIHEYAHCFITDKLGDPTPRLKGRLTLNPLKHLDPLGFIAILFLPFAWGKPAPFDPHNLKNPKKDIALIALAGPLSNLLMAALTVIGLKLLIVFQVGLPQFITGILTVFFIYFLNINIALFAFNLLPISPLDGSYLLKAFLPKYTLMVYENIIDKNAGFILLLLLLTKAIDPLLDPIINFLLNLFYSFV